MGGQRGTHFPGAAPASSLQGSRPAAGLGQAPRRTALPPPLPSPPRPPGGSSPSRGRPRGRRPDPPAAAGSAPSTAAPGRGNMALEAGDMEDGQLSDSDSDMTIAPCERPLQVPVSVQGGRWFRAGVSLRGGSRGRRPPEAVFPPLFLPQTYRVPHVSRQDVPAGPRPESAWSSLSPRADRGLRMGDGVHHRLGAWPSIAHRPGFVMRHMALFSCWSPGFVNASLSSPHTPLSNQLCEGFGAGAPAWNLGAGTVTWGRLLMHVLLMPNQCAGLCTELGGGAH